MSRRSAPISGAAAFDLKPAACLGLRMASPVHKLTVHGEKAVILIAPWLMALNCDLAALLQQGSIGSGAGTCVDRHACWDCWTFPQLLPPLIDYCAWA